MGVVFMINDEGVMAPEEATWPPIVIGEALDGTQRRSPYRKHEWRKRLVSACDIESWQVHDNTVLDSLTTYSHTTPRMWRRYTDVICQSVVFRLDRSNTTEAVVTFLVNVEV